MRFSPTLFILTWFMGESESDQEHNFKILHFGNFYKWYINYITIQLLEPKSIGRQSTRGALQYSQINSFYEMQESYIFHLEQIYFTTWASCLVTTKKFEDIYVTHVRGSQTLHKNIVNWWQMGRLIRTSQEWW